MKILVMICILFSTVFRIIIASKCSERDYGYGGTVCVCNATYCDHSGYPPQFSLGLGQYLHYETNSQGKKMHLTVENFNFDRLWFFILFDSSLIIFELDPATTYQTMMGFGGAMTDAAALNIATLTPDAQEKLLEQYFGLCGIGYVFIRVPLGSTDFSTRYYSYADQVNDTNLSNFSLAEEDTKYKIPLCQRAQNMSLKPIKLFTTSWIAPDWMTEPRRASRGTSKLQTKHYQTYSNYFVKALDAFKEHGLEFWCLTPQNEPLDGSIFSYGFNSLGWLPEEQRDFLGYFLGPTLEKNGYGDVCIMILDDQRALLPFWADIMLADENVNKYTDGIAVHWYSDWFKFSPASLTADTWGAFKDKFLLYTEACVMPEPGKPAVPLGSWNNAEALAFRMIQAFNNRVVGWVDWNIALDPSGGPNWAKNFVDAPIIVNSTSNEFYKQPLFYIIGHFSKFVTPGSKRISLSNWSAKDVYSVAFLTEDDMVVIILCNTGDTEFHALITAGLHGNIKIKLTPHSIHTVCYKNNFFG